MRKKIRVKKRKVLTILRDTTPAHESSVSVTDCGPVDICAEQQNRSLWRRTMPELPGLKQDKWNANPRDRICWRPEMESFHPYQRLSLGKADDWYICSLEETYPNKELKDIRWISETMHIWLLVITSIEAKSQVKRDKVCILHLYCSAFLFALYNIYFLLFCLCDHLAYISIFIWINILLFISETVNCIVYSFLHILLLITCDSHSVFKPGELLILYPNAVFLMFKGMLKG